jgi:casein kinase II subunit beta
LSKIISKYFNFNIRVLLELILSPESPSEEILTEEFMESVQQAKELYGLIHARFITTSKGLAFMREKYLNGVYGHCPRILCDKQILLPVGLSEDLKYSRVKVFCPKCEEIYKPRQKCSEVDGAFFGTSFPQVFLLVRKIK